jgi:hypothetical protein
MDTKTLEAICLEEMEQLRKWIATDGNYTDSGYPKTLSRNGCLWSVLAAHPSVKYVIVIQLSFLSVCCAEILDSFHQEDPANHTGSEGNEIDSITLTALDNQPLSLM